jgi:antitoxin component of MazEF toxin-antitoxin module
MLKKLAKYGNSTTLVIDKAILELLNMDESSIVKLHTDGKSLIITPVVNPEKKHVTAGMDESTQSAMNNLRAIAQKGLEKTAATYSEAEIEAQKALMPQMQQEFKELFERHKTAMAKFEENLSTNLEFAEALSAIEQKYNPKTQSEEYMKEYMKLRTQFFPELAELDKEMKAITEKYSNR